MTQTVKMNELFSYTGLVSQVLCCDVSNKVYPMRPGLFSRSPGPDAKNQGYHQPIEMKLCMSHYYHKIIHDAKFEAGGSSSFGDMTSQKFPRNKGTSHQIRLFTTGKRV